MNKIDQFIRNHTLSVRDIIDGKKPCGIDMTLLREASAEFEILREKQEPCGYCKSGIVSFVYHPTSIDYGIQSPARYCPMCGRKLDNEPKLQKEPEPEIKRPEAQKAEKDLFKQYPYMGCNLEREADK